MFYIIKNIEPDSENYHIKIYYQDDVSIVADFTSLLEKGVMKNLKDPKVFAQVAIDNKGRSIVWKEQDIDFCADSLRLKYQS